MSILKKAVGNYMRNKVKHNCSIKYNAICMLKMVMFWLQLKEETKSLSMYFYVTQIYSVIWWYEFYLFMISSQSSCCDCPVIILLIWYKVLCIIWFPLSNFTQPEPILFPIYNCPNLELFCFLPNLVPISNMR